MGASPSYNPFEAVRIQLVQSPQIKPIPAEALSDMTPRCRGGGVVLGTEAFGAVGVPEACAAVAGFGRGYILSSSTSS